MYHRNLNPAEPVSEFIIKLPSPSSTILNPKSPEEVYVKSKVDGTIFSPNNFGWDRNY
jgi:hypothetical protein